jgi:hypothetical protein
MNKTPKISEKAGIPRGSAGRALEIAGDAIMRAIA